MSDRSQETINFKISGSDLNKDTGYDLFYLSQSMIQFHKLIEKTYLCLKDEKNMSKLKRDDLKVRVHNIRPGSFEADFVMILSNIVPSLLPMVTSLDANSVWKLAKESFEYLKAILNANRQGENMRLENVNAERVNIITGNDNIIMTVHPDVVRTSKHTYPVYKKIAGLIDDKENTFEEANFTKKGQEIEDIKIGVEEKLLLQNENIVEEDTVEFVGEIFKADGNKFTGSLEVFDSEEIAPGEYNFEFIDPRNKVMKEYFQTKHNYVAMKVTSFNPNNLHKNIKRLKIVSVYPL